MPSNGSAPDGPQRRDLAPDAFMAIPNRFTLRQAAQARDDFAQIMDELDFVKEQLARLPTRRDQAFTPLRIMLGSALLSATLVVLGSRRVAAAAHELAERFSRRRP